MNNTYLVLSFSDLLLLPENVPLYQILRKNYFKPQILCLGKPSTEAGLSGHAPGTYFQLGPTSCFLPSSSTVIKLWIYQWIKHSLCQSLLDKFFHFPKAYRLAASQAFLWVFEWIVEIESMAVLLSLVYHPFSVAPYSYKCLLELMADLFPQFEKFQVMFVCSCVIFRIPWHKWYYSRFAE